MFEVNTRSGFVDFLTTAATALDGPDFRGCYFMESLSVSPIVGTPAIPALHAWYREIVCADLDRCRILRTDGRAARDRGQETGTACVG